MEGNGAYLDSTTKLCRAAWFGVPPLGGPGHVRRASRLKAELQTVVLSRCALGNDPKIRVTDEHLIVSLLAECHRRVRVGVFQVLLGIVEGAATADYRTRGQTLGLREPIERLPVKNVM